MRPADASTRAHGRAGLNTERVVRAAADLSDEVGFDGVTVSALARHFGVRDASLYSHVRNLSDLRARVALLATRDFADRITSAVAGRAGKDALTAFAGAYRTFALEHPGRYAATQSRLDPSLLDPSLPDASPDLAAGPRRIIDATYAMMRAYDLPEPDLTDAVRLLRSTFHGYSSLEANGGFRAERDVQASWERAIEALDHLLRNWPRAAPGEHARPQPSDSPDSPGAPGAPAP
ncbi:WHG domain-containing protein [Streptomyces sp. NPDC091376]|uniref:TetR/AcrR family transcriptional regulator n=1 Tax=Streptomyces sp. NPDC091376 TaxID=3365994 RepID=UPI0038053911